MAIDKELVQGAYLANRPQGVPGAKAVSDMTTSITKSVTDLMKADYLKEEKERLAREKEQQRLKLKAEAEEQRQKVLAETEAQRLKVRAETKADEEAKRVIDEDQRQLERKEKAEEAERKKKLEDEKKFAKIYQQAADANNLGDKEKSVALGEYMGKAEAYASASPFEQAEMLSQLQSDAEQYRLAFDIHQVLAENKVYGGDINPHWLENEGKAWLDAAVDPAVMLEKNENGERGWKVNGEFKSLNDFSREIEKHKIDQGFIDSFTSILENSKKQSAKNTNNKFTEYNEAADKQKINILLGAKDVNLVNIATTKIPALGNVSFEDHVKEKLVNTTFTRAEDDETYMLTNDYGKNDEDDKLSRDEAEKIIEHLFKPENSKDLQAELSAWATTMVKQQGWNIGIGSQTTTIDESGFTSENKEFRQNIINKVNSLLAQGDKASQEEALAYYKIYPDILKVDE